MNAGAELEGTVASFLRLQGYDVTLEPLLGHKKVDLLAQEKRFGKHLRIGIECKDYKRRLTKEEVLGIVMDYEPLVGRHIDHILIVTRSGIAPSAQTYIDERPTVFHESLSELRRSTLDLGPHLAWVSSTLENELNAVSHYYVPLEAQEGDDIEEIILEWATAPDPQPPLAILGGYGSGKTSLAFVTANHLARLHREEGYARAPVVLRLGDISAEQTLEGLLGRTFTAMTPCRHYSFDTFMTLCRDGHLVVLLDGFDEMKHSLAWDGFVHNMGQLNRLVQGNNRVVLLGRPNSFLDDEEYEYILHARRKWKDRVIEDPQSPQYKEIHIAPLDHKRIQAMINRYCDFAGISRTTAFELRLDAAVKERDVRELLRRPVHLKMVLDLLPVLKKEDLVDLQLAHLYDLFVDETIERDLRKNQRQTFPKEERRRFVAELAWWMWFEGKGRVITPSSVPAEVVGPFVGVGDDEVAVRRDLAAGSFLDRRLGDTLVFPHRSFQEFFVAQRAVSMIRERQLGAVVDQSASFSEEIVSFIGGLAQPTDTQLVVSEVALRRGKLPLRLAQLCARLPNVGDSLAPWTATASTSRVLLEPNPVLLLLAMFAESQDVRVDHEAVVEASARTDDAGLFALLCFYASLRLRFQHDRVYRVLENLLRCGVDAATSRSGSDPAQGVITLPPEGRRDRRRRIRPFSQVGRILDVVLFSHQGSEINLQAVPRALVESLDEYCSIETWFPQIRQERMPLIRVRPGFEDRVMAYVAASRTTR